jgi:ABC-type enterochelin transport system substrate-binding protein
VEPYNACENEDTKVAASRKASAKGNIAATAANNKDNMLVQNTVAWKNDETNDDLPCPFFLAYGVKSQTSMLKKAGKKALLWVLSKYEELQQTGDDQRDTNTLGVKELE